MQIPNDKGTKLWDRFKETYYGIPGDAHYAPAAIYLFETDEMLVTRCNIDDRRLYREVNIRLTTTADDNCPALVAPDGREIPKAWLNETGQQELLVDYDTMRVVSLEGYLDQRNALDLPVPSRFLPQYPLARAYFPGPGRYPVPGAQITVRPPLSNKDWIAPEQREKAKELLAAAKALVAMDSGHYKGSDRVSFAKLMEVDTIGDLATGNVAWLAQYGIPRPVILLDYLMAV